MRAKLLQAIGLTFLTACGSRQQVLTFPPVEAGQRASVLEAVWDLRKVFNGDNACQSIYDVAAERFRTYAQERWLIECRQLLEDMGSWQDFRARSIVRCGMPEVVVCLDGDGGFVMGDRILELAWSLDGGRAQLLSIAWQDGRQWIRIPPFRDHHFDSPPVPGKDRAKSG